MSDEFGRHIDPRTGGESAAPVDPDGGRVHGTLAIHRAVDAAANGSAHRANGNAGTPAVASHDAPGGGQSTTAASSSGTALDAVGRVLAGCIERILAFRELVFAAVLTTVFYHPSLRNGSRDAGFLYGGDVVGFYWPYLAKLQSLLSRFNFVALDFSHFNASSDFFLAANFFPCHPLFVFWALCTPPTTTTFHAAGRILVIALALHSFLACYFSLRLLRRFFGFDFWTAAFAATAFGFSLVAVNSHEEPMYWLCASILPWAAYAALDYQGNPGFRRLLTASLPIVLGYFGGYVPLGIATLGLAACIVGIRLFLLPDTDAPLSSRTSRFITAMLPFVTGTLVAAPYLAAVYRFLKSSPSAHRASLFYSAHQLAEWPQGVLRLLSFRSAVPGPFTEFTLTWGFIAVAVAALFLLCPRVLDRLSRREWTLLTACGLIYFTIALGIYGQFSAVSDLIFYFVPQVGGMHIYQRFLVPGQFMFATMVALMLRAIVAGTPPVGLRVAAATFAAATLAAAFFVARNPDAANGVGLNNYVVFELLLAALCMSALLVPNKSFALAVTTALFTLPVLDQMYDYAHGARAFDLQVQRHGAMLDEPVRQGVVSYLGRFGGKQLVKYVDITPRWSSGGVEYFGKSFPFFVLHEIPLSSYAGFNFYLSPRADYMATIPYASDTRFQPDWDRITATGADFVVALETDLPSLQPHTGPLGPGDIHRLPNGVVMAPLLSSRPSAEAFPGALFDNGLFRISHDNGNELDLTESNNLARGKPARQSSDGGGPASLAVDGNTDGRFAVGSVTHTAAQAGAWFEVDLGRSEQIGAVRIWNRTECPERLRDFWLCVSEEPFADGAPAEPSNGQGWSRRIVKTPAPSLLAKTPGVSGRYVRIHLASTTAAPENILSLAEVEVFPGLSPAADDGSPPPGLTIHECTTNLANSVELDLECEAPTKVNYLLWNNPGLRYTLDGAPLNVGLRDGLVDIRLPSGRHRIAIRYANPLMTFFWIGYACYGLAVVWSLLTRCIDAARSWMSVSPHLHQPASHS